MVTNGPKTLAVLQPCSKGSLLPAVGRVGENPGNEVECIAVLPGDQNKVASIIQVVVKWGLTVFQNFPYISLLGL